jgi:KUP system potassium uptake protein
MFIWFTMIMVLGILQITHYTAIVKAFNPYYAYDLLSHYPKGFWLLGAVFLCTTGAEALYSDLGHCGKKNIQVSWMFVKVALLANYFGQAAWLLHSGKKTLDNLNPFYEIIPEWFLIPSIIIATLATIIASQALISGSFTLISEAVSLNFWPRITIKYPTDIRGQIYIPSINWILWLGCVGMMLYFKDSAKMEAAYGFSITVAMLMTTTLMFYYMKFVKKWASAIVFIVLFIFLAVEVSFFIANVAKIKQRWMFLVFEFALVFIMFIWYKARKITNRFLQFQSLIPFIPLIEKLSTNEYEPKYATHLVFLTKANNKRSIEKRILESILTKRPKKADVYWFIHIDRTDEPYTMEYTVDEIVKDKIIRIDFKLGFRVQPRINLFFKKILNELTANKQVTVNVDVAESMLHPNEVSNDIRYVLIEKFLSIENEFSFREGFILNAYFGITKMAQSDKKAFGLDLADCTIEKIPMVVAPLEKVSLRYVHS